MQSVNEMVSYELVNIVDAQSVRSSSDTEIVFFFPATGGIPSEPRTLEMRHSLTGDFFSGVSIPSTTRESEQKKKRLPPRPGVTANG